MTTTKTLQGETWDMISKRVYGDEHYMARLIDANIEHRDVVLFHRGIVLNVPDIGNASLVGTALPPWKR